MMDLLHSWDGYLLMLAVLLFISIMVTKLGTRFGIPTLVLFLGIGMLFGSEGFGIEFDNPNAAQDIGAVALSIILFSGGMDTRFESIRAVVAPGLALSTLGVLLTTILTGYFIWWITGCVEGAVLTSLLLAATMSSTDSASVFAILRERNIHLKHNLGPMLELESGSNDPMAFMLTILLIDIIVGSNGSEGVSWGAVVGKFVWQIVMGIGMGWLSGRGAAYVLNRMHVSNIALYPIMLVSIVLATFSFTDLCKGNGYLAVYFAGIILGNRHFVNRDEISHFLGVATWFMQIYMFIILGLLVKPSMMLEVAPVAIAVGLFMMFVGRPVSVLVSLLPFRKLCLRSRLFVSWVGLRGAVPIIFAIYPWVNGVDVGDHIFTIVFFVTIISLIVQGMTLSWAAKKLDLIVDEGDKE
ncbi:MAG: potassium/proton antiporter [Bacteroidaceae bacterium]|nr:potassium/proton antiporter [Bacteroidaceae bacterium]